MSQAQVKDHKGNGREHRVQILMILARVLGKCQIMRVRLWYKWPDVDVLSRKLFQIMFEYQQRQSVVN